MVRLLQTGHFLTSAVAAPASETGKVAQEDVQDRIRALVDGEDKTNPLSDEEICHRLALSGVTVARRTVAKYRQWIVGVFIFGCAPWQGFFFCRFSPEDARRACRAPCFDTKPLRSFRICGILL